ncbi:MAG: formate--tetrahydrofolate ligase [Candidatus Omnitrophica bacterium]|nr:formate--tetrahydrofolate ligase [Candidatus Omnitrophota bacterium]
MTDTEIAQKAKLKPIVQIAASLGIKRGDLELYGDFKAKISLEALKGAGKSKSKYVVITGITPTHLGEGKTVTTIGLSMALNRLGKKAVSCIRQPSLGPFFGIKGGGVGGGWSQVLPMDDINLHLTGDIHAVGQAHNLCASFIDNHLFRDNPLNIDKNKIYWRRVVDVNDRALRNVRIGLGGEEQNGVERDTGFDITAASEIMAILALSDSIKDMRERLSRIVIGLTKDKKPVTAEDLKVAGSMALLLREAIKPSIVQTIEHTPCLIHTGPFANITHGNSSIIADRVAMKFAEYVVTESGFGADCGLEKFANIKCRVSGLKPDAVVLVCSVRALKIHSGIYKMIPGKPLEKRIIKENLEAVEAGCTNLEKQIENSRLYGVPCVVSINRFATDTDKEIEAVRKKALAHGAFDCVVNDCYRYGSKGAERLATAVMEACRGNSKFKFLYSSDSSIKDKIDVIAKKVYGAKSVHLEPAASESIALYEKFGFGKLPICMAKTHLSLSHDPKLKGAPKDFVLPVRDVKPSIGAGFLYALCGKMLTMPSLPAHPAGENIDIDRKGRIRYVHK